MNIYQHKTSITVSGGSAGAVSLNIPGGLINYVLVRANTDTTMFRANINDGDDTRINYPFHQGEIVDDKINHPITGNVTLNVTNASVNDTFRIVLSVRE